MRTARYFVALTFVASLVTCGGSSAPEERGGGSTTPATNGRQVATDKNAYPVFPDADSGADPSVPADQGGRGFTGQGWATNTDFDLIGDPRAVKGGRFRRRTRTFRTPSGTVAPT